MMAASDKEIYEIIGRAVADKDFRTALMKDPKKATSDLGYILTEDQLLSLKESDLAQLSEELNTRVSKMGIGGCGIAGLGLLYAPK